MSQIAKNAQPIEIHLYDIDAFEILDRLKEKHQAYNDNSKGPLRSLEFIHLEEEFLMESFKESNIDLTEQQKRRHFVIPSTFNLYNTFLGYKLLTIDLYKIESLLSYQLALFEGNYYAEKNNFIGLIEFSTYAFVSARVFPFEENRLEKISNWVEKNRVFLRNNELPFPKDGADLKVDEVIMDDDFAIIFNKQFKKFFKGQENDLEELIINKKATVRLVFNGQANQLAELFKRLRYNGKISVSSIEILAHWIVRHFAIRDKQKGIEKLNLSTISQVLKKTTAEPAKGKRILEELAGFKVTNQRK